MLFQTRVNQSLLAINSISSRALNRCINMLKGTQTWRRLFLLLKPTSKMCLAVCVILVQHECLFLEPVYGDFKINRWYALITEKICKQRSDIAGQYLTPSLSNSYWWDWIIDKKGDSKVTVKLACYKNFLHYFHVTVKQQNTQILSDL